MTDFRELCAELLESAEELEDLMQGAIDSDYMPDSLTLQPIRLCLDQARSALAQPEPQRPTDEDLYVLFDWLNDEWLSNNEGEFPLPVFARAVLARWGRPAIEPVPQQEGNNES